MESKEPTNKPWKKGKTLLLFDIDGTLTAARQNMKQNMYDCLKKASTYEELKKRKIEQQKISLSGEKDEDDQKINIINENIINNNEDNKNTISEIKINIEFNSENNQINNIGEDQKNIPEDLKDESNGEKIMTKTDKDNKKKEKSNKKIILKMYTYMEIYKIGLLILQV